MIFLSLFFDRKNSKFEETKSFVEHFLEGEERKS